MRGFLCFLYLPALIAVAACSDIIGVSDLEIDPSLDAKGSGGKGATGAGGDAALSPGGDENGGSAGAGASGEAGMGGSPLLGECENDCDDEIACTTDACVSGKCVHTTDDSRCQAASCETCRAGIGCVAGRKVTQELLLDGGFDEQSADWQDYSDADVILPDASARSGTHSAYFSAAPPNNKEAAFFDLAQVVHIPPRTAKLTASGSYKMIWASTEAPMRPRSEEYVTLSLFSIDVDENDKYTRYLDFAQWDADKGPPQPEWKAFSYDAPKSVLSKVQDLELTLDVVAETWDTVYYFDTLSLQATVCE